ncbi:MAG TPA: SH3 domain-containing protein, partial [Gemmataceae bacterium]|nr:SH3 domain-containing protein [Gemmataceae bacterium]
MPSLQVFGGMVLALTLGTNPSASNILYTATVKVPTAEVRSGPSDKYYPTNRLRQGDVVEVVKEAEGGWLAVKPPPGSLSWINTRLVRQLNARTWAVVAPNDAPVLIGSRVVDEKPTVVGVHVKQGTLFVSVWETKTADDGSYLPVEPPPGELRYVRGEDVSKNLVPGEASAPVTAAAPPPL